MNGAAVWITGIGAVSAAGPDAHALRDLLTRGGTAVRPAPALHGLDSARVPELPKRAVAQLATARGVKVRWKKKLGFPVARWANRDETERIVALLGDNLFAITSIRPR